MMLNLFTMFDPNLSYFSFNWMSSNLFMLIIPQMFWFYPSRIINILTFFMTNMWLEYKMILSNKFNLMNLIFFISMFFFFFFSNFMGLFPYIFTSSSHLHFSLSFSLPMWFGLMLFGWLNNTNHMFTHLVPMGTPFILMFFMVIIETLSNIIRPLTLSIRLVANMIAGHLLLTLLSMFAPKFMMMYFIILIIQLLLLILEISVSIIQSYVFVILLILYMKEIN
uniref:ATP synthase subunit a n=1 Tax=Zele chlorophthalmus TaxID=1080924 RepID=A0A345X0Q4_ZELCH|nr:ATP synthase F0 subunit 6 [Zele chlorophthalmus]AXK15296.1 ATP synthase F0 subunit 6 [Zele chlorophthalmus]